MESDLCFERGTMIIDGSCPPGSSASLYMWKVESILIMWKNMDSIFISVRTGLHLFTPKTLYIT